MKSHCLAALASEVAALLEQPDKQDPKTRLCSSGDLIKLRRHGAPIRVVGSGVTRKTRTPRAGAIPASQREPRDPTRSEISPHQREKRNGNHKHALTRKRGEVADSQKRKIFEGKSTTPGQKKRIEVAEWLNMKILDNRLAE